MLPTKFIPIYFFHAFSGLLRVILTSTGAAVCILRWNLGLFTQVNLSLFCSNSLSYKWHPPADLSDHFPESTAFFESSNFSTSNYWELKTIVKKVNMKGKGTGKGEISCDIFLTHRGYHDKGALSGLVKCINSSYIITFIKGFFVPLSWKNLEFPF